MNDTSRPATTISIIDQVIAPVAFFVAAYAASLFVLVRYLPLFQWAALLSAIVATSLSVAVWDRGRWPLGLFVPPRLGVRESVAGVALALLLIGSAHVLVLLSTAVRHAPGHGFPAGELVAVFLPAVFHEELLFRGYAFQRLWRTWPTVAIVSFSAVFAGLHAWNTAVTPLALTNIFLGGVLLSLAYALFERLWLPIGLHLGWNLLSGPILGYAVSGYAPEESVLRLVGTGPPLLTGGRFGIEGSIWMTVLEITAILILIKGSRMKKGEIPHSSIRYEER